MIHLRVEDYCQNCPEFDPDVQCYSHGSGSSGSYINTTICCLNKERCASMMEYLRKETDRE